MPFTTTERAAALKRYVALNLVKRVRRDGNSEAVAET
jgi:hypothetical protein